MADTTPPGPDFIVIGAMKCGTSTVCAYFEDHPEVFMPPDLEPHFFSHDAAFERGEDWYRAIFAPGGGHRLRGEGSNSYTAAALYPHAPARMAAFDPGLRLVYVVRHPIERIVSAWLQRRRQDPYETPPTLGEALEKAPERYVDQSLYWAQLERYLAHFPPERIHVCFMEDMARDEAGFFAALCGFLGIEPTPHIARPAQNRTIGARVMSPAFTRLRALPGARRAARLMPEGLKRRVYPLFARRIAEKPRLSRAEHRRLAEALVSDSARLLAHCGKPADFWRLEP